MPADSATFTRVYREHYPHVSRYMERYCNNLYELEDVMQEAMFRAWQKWDSRQTENIRAWLIGMAKYTFLSFRRNGTFRPFHYSESYDPELDTRIYVGNQESAAELSRFKERFNVLSPNQRSVVEEVMKGVRLFEIASERDVSQSAISNAFHLALQKFNKIGYSAETLFH